MVAGSIWAACSSVERGVGVHGAAVVDGQAGGEPAVGGGEGAAPDGGQEHGLALLHLAGMARGAGAARWGDGDDDPVALGDAATRRRRRR